MRITLEVFGDRQLDRELLRWQASAEDASPAFQQMADDFLAIEGRQFASEGGYASGGWAPLNASYLRWKVRHGFDPRILHRTGRLVASLTNPGAPDAVRRIGAHEMVVGTTVPYAGAHQQGGRVPRRRPVELTAADRERWVRILQRYLATGVAA